MNINFGMQRRGDNWVLLGDQMGSYGYTFISMTIVTAAAAGIDLIGGEVDFRVIGGAAVPGGDEEAFASVHAGVDAGAVRI